MKKMNLKRFGLLGLLAGMISLNSCAGSCQNACSDISRDAIRRDYVLTLYGCDGKEIEKRELKHTFIEVSENGSGIRYVQNDKLIMINGTYILEEK
ncbi:hypothetical protein J4474_04015 [Candidatus Pacearchaeota archaeon]|nr:hypothetical protein [Candidatus Pacearchaeota archaeon]